jgi:hypothetical protein
MKNIKKIIVVQKFFFVILLMLSFSFSVKSQVVCPFPFTNSLSCSVDVTFEFNDNTCAATCVSSPITLTCPANTTINLLGGGCCTGAVEIHLNITDFGGASANTTIITVNGGCNGSIPTSDSGATPATSGCVPTTYSITTSATGATIQP